MLNLPQKSPSELLQLYVGHTRRTSQKGHYEAHNNPVADVADTLFCKAFGWNLEENSTAHYDATGLGGATYQVKGRRLTRENRSRQLSQIRGLDDRTFDFLAGVLFDHNFGIFRAAIVPAAGSEIAFYVRGAHKELQILAPRRGVGRAGRPRRDSRILRELSGCSECHSQPRPRGFLRAFVNDSFNYPPAEMGLPANHDRPWQRWQGSKRRPTKSPKNSGSNPMDRPSNSHTGWDSSLGRD